MIQVIISVFNFYFIIFPNLFHVNQDDKDLEGNAISFVTIVSFPGIISTNSGR